MKVVIIGGTAAGMSGAAKLRRTDKKAEIIVYEKRDYISFGACSLPYYAGGFFDQPEDMIARTPDEMRNIEIQIELSSEVIGLEPKQKILDVKNLVTGEIEKVSYDQVMIATGAYPAIPSIENLHLGNVFTLHSLEDGKGLRKALEESQNNRVVVIGAGFIGLEVVDAAKRLGKEVTVLQKSGRILGRMFDAEITSMLEHELSEKGVMLHTGVEVEALRAKKDCEPNGERQVVGKVITNQGEFDAEIVVIATGVKPATEFLQESGIACLPNGGIIVDEKGQTNIEGIYAAGDCATVPHQLQQNPYIPLGTSANKLGRVVGENLGGRQTKYQKTLGSSCIKVLGLDAARTGLTEEQARENGYAIKTSFVADMNQTNYYPGQAKIHVKLIYEEESKVILGAQMVGAKDVVQRVNVLACAVYNQMTTMELGMLDLCYAPPFSKTWDVLNIAGNASK